MAASTPKDLPIWKLHDALQRTWSTHNRFVLISPTGSGKTTQVCQMLFDSKRCADKQIIVLQPRRVATRVVAARVAFERGTPIGGEVGYQIRFEDQISKDTRIRFMTEGVLLRLFVEDSSISGIGAILFDEFHERNLFSDVALGLALQLQQKSRPDLLLGVMSATLEAEPIADFFENCPVLQSEGRSHPVQIHYLDAPDSRTVQELAAERVAEIVNETTEGDILVFMPGMGEILQTIREIEGQRIDEPLQLIPLHGDLPPEQQDLAFTPSRQRKVIVSTNVAETSVTLEGVKFVVDSGLARISRYDPSTGIATLKLEPISRASAQQRTGRAGRTSPGVCYRLWTLSGQKDRPEQNTPEIHRTDLSSMVLLLHSLGIPNVATFPLPDRPDPEAVRAAEEMLERLGALQTAESLRISVTPIGREMLKLPVHPRYARMLIEARKLGCVRAAALFASLTAGRDLLLRTRDKEVKESRELFETNERSDFFTLANAFRYAQKHRFDLNACRRMGIHAQTARLVDQTAFQLLDVCERHHFDISEKPMTSDDPILKCVLAGFADHLAIRQDTGTLECDLLGGRQGTLARESVVQKSRVFVAAEIRTIESRDRAPITLLQLASAVEIAWLKEMFPEQITEKDEAIYDARHRRVECIRTLRFRDLLLGGEAVESADPAVIARALAEELVDEPISLPEWNHEVKQWIGRVRAAAAAAPDYGLPTYTRAECVTCLARAFEGLKLFKDAKEKPLLESFKGLLTRDQQEFVNFLAPPTLALPSGVSIKLLYSEDGGVSGNLKLHDALKLEAHPLIGDQKVRILLHLQTPDNRKLESTGDLSAWRRVHYPKLRPTLIKKFPSVAWP